MPNVPGNFSKGIWLLCVRQALHGSGKSILIQSLQEPCNDSSLYPECIIACWGRIIPRSLYFQQFLPGTQKLLKFKPLRLTESGGKKVTQSCPTLCDPKNYSLPGSSVHGWVANSFSREIFPNTGLNSGLLHCRQNLYRLSHQGSP